MSKTIYVVKSSQGVYEDYREWNEKAFTNEEDAIKYANELDQDRFSKPSFINDEFEEAYRNCYEELPDWEDGPEFEDDSKAYYEYHEKKDREFIIKTMKEKGFDLTSEMIDQYDEWESNSFDDWNECEVEELELCD